MIGQAISVFGKKYNIVILAGGNGNRMGEQSDYIPKALSQIGNRRSIDYIIERYLPVAEKFVVGTCRHADLLESYIKGRFPNVKIDFSRELDLVNNAISLMYCLDHTDSRFGTIVLFCDLLVVSNPIITDDTVLVVSSNTKGKVGTFRHYDSFSRGILGHFVFGNTYKLKSITYSKSLDGELKDITESVVPDYGLASEECEKVFEFGNETDLAEVRRLWEYA